MRKLNPIFFLSVFFAITGISLKQPNLTFAAKTRVWTTGSAKTTVASRPSFSVTFRSDRRALNIRFYNLKTASSTSYELTYNGSGNDQGVVGSALTSEGNSASRLLLFGTCSHGVCTYHQNIQNMQLTITSKLNTGKTLIKRYKIKV